MENGAGNGENAGKMLGKSNRSISKSGKIMKSRDARRKIVGGSKSLFVLKVFE